MADRQGLVVFILLAVALAGCTGQNAPADASSTDDGEPTDDAGSGGNGTRDDPSADGNGTEPSKATISASLVWATDQAIVRWDPETDNRTRIELGDAAGGSYEITAIRWGPDGGLYATTMASSSGPAGMGWATSGGQGVFRIDLASGSVETVHTGPPLQNPLALTVLDDGRVLVADRGAAGFPPGGAPSPSGQIVDIASDGTATVLTADPRFGGWLGLHAVDGTIYLTTQNDQRMTSPDDAGGTGALWRIDPAIGSHEVASSSSVLQEPSGVTPDGEGGLYLSEWGGQRVLRVDPSSGEATVVSPVNGSQNLWGLDTLPDGRIVAGAQDGIWLVDPATGASRKLVTADGSATRHVRVVGSA